MSKQPVSRWAKHVVQSLKPFIDSGYQRSIVNQMLNYHPLARRLDAVLSRNQTIALFYFDIVKMKDIEERYGDGPGEILIQALSEAINLCLHATVREQSIIAIENFWADDFIVCIESGGMQDEQVYQLASALRRDISEQLYHKTKQFIQEKVELHVGYAFLSPDRGRLEKQLYLGIKQAMRIAKRGDDIRNTVIFGELQSILTNRTLRSHYQPIVDLHRPSIVGWEALSRGPQGSSLERPDHLFSYAEEFGELFAMEKISRESAIAHIGSFPRNQKLFLNMNPRMVDDSRFVSGWTKQLLSNHDIEPDQIVFEITERHSIRDFAGFRKALNHYRDQGYLIAVDDVGSGYSNLQSIVELAPDYVKMDMSLIRNIDSDPTRQAILEAFVTIAGKVRCKLLAEGIETEEELRMVKRLGVHLGQGFLLGKPAPQRQNDLPNRVLQILERDNVGTSISQRHGVKVTIGELCSRTYTVSKNTEVKALHELFDQQRDVTSIVVIDHGEPLGLVTRQQLYQTLGSQYGVPLYFNKTASEVMDMAPLILDKQIPMEQAATFATERSRSKMYDDVIVLDGTQYYGVVTVNHLLQSMSRVQIELAKYANPLTGLPGNVRIEEELVHRIESRQPFDIVYADLNAFKSFNDRYGFERGDRLILLTAKALQRSVKKYGTEDDFIGHIGGDDFIIVVSENSGKTIGQEIIRQFERAKRVVNLITLRQTADNKSDGVAVALAAMNCQPAFYTNHLEISEHAAELKKVAKQYLESTLVYRDKDGIEEVIGGRERRIGKSER